MGKAGSLLEITRPVNSVMLGLAIIVGAAITGGAGILGEPLPLLYAFITGWALTGASMAVNDYYDRDIDAVNEPGRPIPSGRVTPGEALSLTAVLSIAGLTTSYLVSPQAFAVAGFSWVVMMMYSAWGKRTGFPGNLMVSTCIALPFVYGGVLTGNLTVSLSFSLMAFLSNTGREVAKGIVDVEGDRSAGVRTVAVSRGAGTASRVAAAFFVAAAASSVVPVYLGLVSLWYVPFVAATDLGLVHGAVSLVRGPSRENSRRVKNRVLYLMLVGLVGFAAGSLL
ncbi:MAG TPA: UbiA family prenyltransferase [Candidatus Desulfaltia sp.]|nr:UbiA family prenyltransferase [Candidatus Desulfaltia sp.]